MKYLNTKIFKNKKFKLIVTSLILTVSFAGCNVNNQKESNNNINNNTSIVEENFTDLIINPHNLSEEQCKNETIAIGNGTDGLYSVFSLKTTDSVKVSLKCTDSKTEIVSATQNGENNIQTNSKIVIDEVNSDEIVVLDIDYSTNKMTYHTESIQNSHVK